MTTFTDLAGLAATEQESRGFIHTVREIAQQPALWPRVLATLGSQRDRISAFLRRAGLAGRQRPTVILTGAGSSEFVGNAIAPVLRARLGREVLAVPTTQIVTHPGAAFIPGQRYLVVSFARSGDSPESMATWNIVRETVPLARQLAITCNAGGALAAAAAADPRSLAILLPPESNDRSLAMTSSWSSMALAGMALGWLHEWEALEAGVKAAAAAAAAILAGHGAEIAAAVDLAFTRACFLGSGALAGMMREARLKMIELTAGRVAAVHDSFMGIRHGPQVFIDDDCLVAASLSSDPRVLRYEMDLLRELQGKRQGRGVLALCLRAPKDLAGLATRTIELAPDSGELAEEWRVLTDIVAWQALATSRSISLGLAPDRPSATGIINRVVSGVTIYEH